MIDALDTEDGPRALRNPWFILACSIAGAFAVYGICLGNLWYNDDVVFLMEAERLRLNPKGIITNSVMGFFRPVFTGYIAILRLFFELNPVGYYLLGILIHAFNSVAIWALARKLIGGTWGPIVSCFTFLTFFSHCEATLWISSHNSSMLAGFSILAILAHIRAVESKRFADAIVTMLAVGLTLFTKETGLIVIGWIGLAECIYFGWRSVLSRHGMVRYALILVMIIFYIYSNPGLRASFDAPAPGAGGEQLRVSLANVTVSKILAGYGWLFSPFITTQRTIDGSFGFFSISFGILALVAPFIIIYYLERRLLKTTIFASFIALTGLLGPAMFRNISANGSRFYYYSTAGAALTVGLVVAAVFASNRPWLRSQAVRISLLSIIAFAGIFHASRIYQLNAILYRPSSIDQTMFLRSLRYPLSTSLGEDVYIVEPEIPNLLHLEHAFELIYSIQGQSLRMEFVKKREFQSWLANLNAQHARDKYRVIQWTRDRGVFTPTGVPKYSPTYLDLAHPRDSEWKEPNDIRIVHVLPRN